MGSFKQQQHEVSLTIKNEAAASVTIKKEEAVTPKISMGESSSLNSDEIKNENAGDQ